jgi:hypothetical protein
VRTKASRVALLVVCVFASRQETRAHNAPAVPMLVRAPMASARQCTRVGHLQYTGGAIRNILSMQMGNKHRGYHYQICFKKYYETENNPYYTHTSTPALAAHDLHSSKPAPEWCDAGWLVACFVWSFGTWNSSAAAIKLNRAIAFLNPVRTKPNGVAYVASSLHLRLYY